MGGDTIGIQHGYYTEIALWGILWSCVAVVDVSGLILQPTIDRKEKTAPTGICAFVVVGAGCWLEPEKT